MTPTLADVLLRRHADSGEQPFVRFEDGQSHTYGQSVRRAASLARALRAAGLAKGDRVLLALDNRPEFLDAWFGCALGGFVMVPLNTLMTGRLLEDIVQRSRTRALVAQEPYCAALEALCEGAAIKIIAGGERPGWMAHAALIQDDGAPEAASLAGADPMSVMFTSGTTGPAKGAILSQAHCVARSDAYRKGLRIDASDVMFTCLPLFHNNAQMASVLVAVLARAQAVVQGRFSVQRFWRQIRESGATRFTLIGRMANLLLAAPPDANERAHAVRSACIVPHPQGEEAFERRFGIRVISQYYGCTEMLPLPPDIDQPRRPGSCGRPGPGYECMVADAEGQPVPDGEVGEFLARPLLPEGVMSGYLDMPGETLHAWRGLWYHTGDAVKRDAEGYYSLVGRLKEFIRRKGENISATEIEAIVNAHPAVADCAAIGEPDEWGEEDVVLYVEAKPCTAAEAEAETLHRYCAERLPAFMVPARIHVIDALPRNALGRIEKFKLRKR